jgi:methylated-DNA-[protein]-cysteine S-methyltransferase
MSAANKPSDVRLVAFPTALGWMGAAVSPRGLAMLTLPWPTRQAALDEVHTRYPTAALVEEAILGDLPERMRRYLAGERVDFPQALDLTAGTPFQQQVWAVLQRIPAGETRSYGWVAAAIGRPRAARAVGQAVGANPINIIVPCHRVVGSDGSLTGYGGGLPLKQRLLDLERHQP